VTAPTTQSTSIEEALAHIAAEPVIWVRLAAMRKAIGQDTGGWEQMMLDLVSGEAPPNWESLYWCYPKCLFVASEHTGEVVAGWFKQQCVNLNGEDIALPEVNGPIQWERRDSLSTYGAYQSLPWPTIGANLGNNAAGQDTGTGTLIGDGAPAFPTFYTAASFVFNVAQAIGGGRANAAPTYRHQDSSARINRVQIVSHEDVVRVEIEGDDLDGAQVELGGNVPGPVVSLTGAAVQHIELPLTGELPGEAFVLVRRADHWLDRRVIVSHYGVANQPGIEYVVDPANRLEGFIAGRESPTVDFKGLIPHKKEVHTTLQAMKSVAAFANENGGVLLFGVNDEEEIVGISRSGLDGTKNHLVELVSSWVDPRPTISFEEFPVEGHADLVVLGMWVERGASVPYMAGQPGHTKTVYIRNHSSSSPARQYEILRIVQSRVPNEPGGLFSGRHM